MARAGGGAARLLACVWVLSSVALSAEEVASKFSLRNEAGGHIGLWWISPGRPESLVPQAKVTVRPSSALEINSYRGHRFLVRRQPKGHISEGVYVPAPDDTVLVIGSTNDIVVVDGDLRLVRHDAAYKNRLAARRAWLDCGDDAACFARAYAERVGAFRTAWLIEERTRKAMATDVVRLGGNAPSAPVPPPRGWPDRAVDVEALAAAAVTACLGGRAALPIEALAHASLGAATPEAVVALLRDGWRVGAAEIPDCVTAEVCDVAPLLRLAYVRAGQLDSHRFCGLWARLGECAANAAYMLESCPHACALTSLLGAAPLPAKALLAEAADFDGFIECVASAADTDVAAFVSGESAEINSKSDFGDALRNLTCAAAAGTEAPLYDASARASRLPHRLLDAGGGRAVEAVPLYVSEARDAANITLLRNFSSAAECAHVMDVSRPNLQPATVNEEGNKAAKSLSRRAYAAMLAPDPKDKKDPAAKLWRRAFSVANALTGYDLDVEGQEPFSVIHYNGTRQRLAGGLPDEYRPHCDGSCDGSPHMHGGRVATLLLYCGVPTSGGATTFTNARTVVRPSANDAVLFSYYDVATREMDTGFTQHSGCPVLDGDKWVVTLWMRKGVHAGDSWAQYDPTGCRHEVPAR